MVRMTILLSERQRDILRLVVEEYVATGQPVGSKALVESAGLGVSPSTVRYELAELERIGLLTHPHTSAGRVPTETGYRLYVDELLTRPEPMDHLVDYYVMTRPPVRGCLVTMNVPSRSTSRIG